MTHVALELVHVICIYRIACQFSLEVILSAAFGHQVDILGGNATDDELYKAAKVMCGQSNLNQPLLTHPPTYLPLFLSVTREGDQSGFLLSSYTKPALHFANITRSLVQARRRMPTTDRVSP